MTYLRQEPLRNYENQVVLLDVEDSKVDTPLNFLVPELVKEGIQVSGLGLPGSKNWLRAYLKLKHWLEKNPVDLIHTNLLASNIVGRLAGYFTGIPVLTTYHNLDYSLEAKIFHFNGSGFKMRVMQQIDRTLARRACPAVIAVSQCVADHIHEKLDYPSNRIRLVYNPVDPIHLSKKQGDSRAWVRQQLGIGEHSRVLINVCRMVYQKNLPRLVEAFKAARDKHPDTHLVLLGSTQNRTVYDEVCAKITANDLADHVHMVGPSHDVADWLSGSDLFIFPSMVEGMGIALAEAMSLGLPCVSSRIGPIPEFIQDHENGLLIDPQSTSQIAAAMLELLSDEALSKKLGEAARETAHRMFNPHSQAEKLVTVYEEVLQANGKLVPRA